MPKIHHLKYQAGFAVLLELLVGALVFTSVIGAIVMMHSAQLANQQKADQQASDAKLAQSRSAKSKLAPLPTAAGPITPPVTAPASTTPAPKPTPAPAPKPVPAPAPVPAPSPAPAPTTVTIHGTTYPCEETQTQHWKGLVYANNSPTYSYTSPNGNHLNSYPQWTNITGLSCSATQNWLQRGNEFFSGNDLIIS